MLEQLDVIVAGHKSPVILAGHSWGAVLGIEYAAGNSKKVAGLATMCSGLSHEHWFTEYQKEKERLGLLSASPKEIFLAPNERVEGKALLDSSWETFSEETFESLNLNYLSNYDLTKSFSNLQMPILNIFGEMDVRFPPKVTKSFAKHNPNVVDLEVKGAGHFPFLQQSQRVQIHQAMRNVFPSP